MVCQIIEAMGQSLIWPASDSGFAIAGAVLTG
jgi:hypothetical protein